MRDVHHLTVREIFNRPCLTFSPVRAGRFLPPVLDVFSRPCWTFSPARAGRFLPPVLDVFTHLCLTFFTLCLTFLPSVCDIFSHALFYIFCSFVKVFFINLKTFNMDLAYLNFLNYANEKIQRARISIQQSDDLNFLEMHKE
jgi:hypothetical protein